MNATAFTSLTLNQQRNSLYFLIQKLCSRPAHFWHNYRYKEVWTIELMLERNYGWWLREGLLIGYIQPEIFCGQSKYGPDDEALSRASVIGS